ncbi:MAG: type II/IV secretion system protein [Actinobacteria bacterium]|nr:type II/IV secretion system protein [Actinomycetota bacterium]
MAQAMNMDDHPELRLVGDKEQSSHGDDHAGGPLKGGHSDLVADVIRDSGALPPEKVDLVREGAQDGSFSQALIDQGFASSLGVARRLAEQYHLPLVDLAVAGVDSAATKIIALPVLERVSAIAFATDGTTLKVAITNPQDVRGLDELRLATRQSVEFFVAAKNDVMTELRRLSRAAEAMNAAFLGDVASVGEDDDLEADDGISDAPLVRLVNSMIFAAAEDGASDIHVEPQENDLVVRYRIDGVLHVAQRIPKRLAAGVTTRLKVLAKLDIAERRKPQDGRITLSAAAAGRLLDIRVATLPTVEGEAVTMRLLDKSRAVPTLVALGLSEPMQRQMSGIIVRPTGALLVTGPTGSGKSTSLYAALAEISRPEINIITVEDPVEYRLSSINQVQINPRAGLTFATALRSILRSDPDVVMVGEIRDGETARISIEAALTGHFVLSTLHTNDAPSALTRLNEMGVEPFITGAAVSAVLAQRLARKLCPHCSESYQPSREELRSLHLGEERVDSLQGSVFQRKKGCARCGQTGYRGRVGIFQLLEMTSQLEQLASEKGSREEIAQVARSEGMQSLWEDGIGKVAAGITTTEELVRVCSG